MAEAVVPEQARARPYAWYVLFVLFLVYALNFIDRQILTILAPHIRKDLGLSQADIGFLYGTAFGVFYALFGIPLGRLADNWHRIRLMTIGLALWSTMTALSGLARNGIQLAGARIGVGVGEASAGPAAYSLISDWFPKRQRATALAIYSGGLYFGAGFSLFIGGTIADKWNHAYPGGGPLGLVGWQAAFMAVGLPGLILALWVATLREPMRGQSEGLVAPANPAPFKAFFADLLTIIPPLTLIGALRSRSLVSNLVALVLITAATWGLILFDGGQSAPLQWLAVGIGVYAVFSWASALRHRDLPTYRLIVASPAFVCVVIAYGLNAFIAYSVAAFAPSHAAAAFGVSAAEAGLWIGGPAILAGFAGVTLGGIAADRLRQKYATGRIMVVLFGSLAPVPTLILAFTTTDKYLFYALLPVTQILASCALGSAAAATQDLVLPRMRGTATAAFFIGTTLVGLALGPYIAGHIADIYKSIPAGILSLLATLPIAFGCALAAYKLVPQAEATREERARAAGEPI
ncbi:MAG: MFS transporter [Sphingomonas sp.]|uniref:spinster family MFS transporter n=1 Tax=Sphingomonas sp. TaxID=28214 RepID=UPI0025E63CF2|nr:MFS transporter [Sphingomonas sp.]MBX3566071.1 MFS transporter [Sphingomonas sp.]